MGFSTAHPEPSPVSIRSRYKCAYSGNAASRTSVSRFPPGYQPKPLCTEHLLPPHHVVCFIERATAFSYSLYTYLITKSELFPFTTFQYSCLSPIARLTWRALFIALHNISVGVDPSSSASKILT